MTNTDLIKELRALTQAGMKDCREALEEAKWDLQKAVDIVKVKGLNIADGRSGRVAADGRIALANNNEGDVAVMVEVNCQTDFVAKSGGFVDFADKVADHLYQDVKAGREFDVNTVEDERKGVIALTKENVVVRRWAAEQSMDPSVRVFAYLHTNDKIGVVMSLQAPSQSFSLDKYTPLTLVNHPDFVALGNDLVMQITAMNPLAVSADRLAPTDLERQKAIFETQLKEEGKPQAMWDKIMIGKMRKWNTEVCLLEQESVVVPKTSVGQVIKNVGAKLGGEITVVNFVRFQVGEGIEKKQDNLTEEVAKLMVDQVYAPDVRK